MSSYFRTVSAVIVKELKVYFHSPLAYAFLSIVLFLAGLFFFIGVTKSGEATIRPMTSNLAIALVFLLPILGMRQFSEERRQGTLELLLTAPVSPSAVLLGKWFAMLFLCQMMLIMSLYFPLLLSFYGPFSWSSLVGDYVGLFLCASVFSAVALFSSLLFSEPVSAALGGVVFLLPFWLIGMLNSYISTAWLSRLCEELSFVSHLRRLSSGVVLFSDLLWFFFFTTLFLMMTQQLLRSQYGRN